ncbi:MAG TPA: hypothetical protein DE179_00855 [Oceanospirillaceae bacterium]|nr:hypothetical protein [Oceanospirillaceae bacterium]
MDSTLKTLLDLDGSILDQGNGYWIKIDAWQVPVSKSIPHGIRYALSLHEPYGKRILGYDNAHAIKLPNKYKYAGKKWPYDHRHRHSTDKGITYEFTDAHQLLSDFFSEVDQVLQEEMKS